MSAIHPEARLISCLLCIMFTKPTYVDNNNQTCLLRLFFKTKHEIKNKNLVMKSTADHSLPCTVNFALVLASSVSQVYFFSSSNVHCLIVRVRIQSCSVISYFSESRIIALPLNQRAMMFGRETW